MNQPQLLSRRAFLGVSLGSLCGACLAACSAGLAEPKPEDYWMKNRQDLLDDFDATLNPVRQLVVEISSEQEAAAILDESRKGYEALLPQVPYIGGDGNSLTEVLYLSGVALAFYRIMQAHGYSLEDTGRIVYRAIEAQVNFHDPLSAAETRNSTGKAAQDEYRRMARQSEISPYPYDWKLAFVAGDGQAFDFGVDYMACGVVKFYRTQRAEELAPYLCLGDFPISQFTNTGLVRTTTLARGGPRCDFRFKAGRPVQMEWTPEFLKGQ